MKLTNRRLSVIALACASFLFPGREALAQAAPAATASPVPAGAATANVQKMAEGDESLSSGGAYTYDPAGRRDPFKSLLTGGGPKTGKGDGIGGILIEELSLQGVWKTRSGLVAQMAGPNSKSWLLRKGDQLLDGEVLNLTTNEIVFRQNVNDPTMLKPFREVVRELIPTTSK